MKMAELVEVEEAGTTSLKRTLIGEATLAVEHGTIILNLLVVEHGIAILNQLEAVLGDQKASQSSNNAWGNQPS